jgi:hypothetical protein
MDEKSGVVALFANFINYLDVSCYESQMTKQHEDARTSIHEIYNSLAENPPTKEQCVCFYNNIRILANVTYTDDPNYFEYKRILRKYIADYP